MSINPLFLFVLFSLGYVFGLLLKNPTAGKFLIFGFAGIFIYEAVKDAGLIASAVFVAGVISHHITASTIIDRLPRLSLRGRSSSKRGDGSGGNQGQRKSKESTDETHDRYADFVKRNRREKTDGEDDIHHRRGYTSRNAEYRKKAPEKEARRSKRKKPRAETDTAKDDLRREKERLQREKDRLETERRKFNEEQRDQKTPPDNRSDEQILNLSGDYTLTDLKKARNAEVQRWNTSNMRHKPPHLIQHAEEEAKKINLAYERLVVKFR